MEIELCRYLYGTTDNQTVSYMMNLMYGIGRPFNTTKFTRPCPPRAVIDSYSPVRIAFSGKICAGKTYAANQVVERIGATKMSIADPLKHIAYTVFGMDPIIKDRKLLQELGSAMKEIDQNVWINCFVNNLPPTGNIVVDDVRFVNELMTLKQHGFTVVRLEIPEHIRMKRCEELYPETTTNHNHISETALDGHLDKFDIVTDDVKSIVSTIALGRVL